MAASRKTMDITAGEVDEVAERNSQSAKSERDPVAKLAASPAFNSGRIAHAFSGIERLNAVAMVKELNTQGKELAHDNKTESGERMLVAQAKALDSIFAQLALMAEANIEHKPKITDLYLKLALKAQAQSRCTWETLSKIKNPPNVSFVKQANYAAGHQQVNNGVCQQCQPSPRTDGSQSQKSPNELLEKQHGERLDSGASTETVPVNPALETLGKGNRAQNRGGKS